MSKRYREQAQKLLQSIAPCPGGWDNIVLGPLENAYEEIERQANDSKSKTSYEQAVVKIAPGKILQPLLALQLPRAEVPSPPSPFWALSEKYGDWEGGQVKSYDTLIVIAGYSQIPIALSVLAARARYVYFLETRELYEHQWTKHNVAPLIQEYCKLFGTAPPELICYDQNKKDDERSKRCKIAETSGPGTFAAVQNILDTLSAEESRTVAIDVTGGKNSMMGGAFAALSPRRRCEIIYIDSLLYDQEKRRPVAGTEYICRIEHPDEVFSESSFDTACRFFDNHRYGECIVILEKIENSLQRYIDLYKKKEEQEKATSEVRGVLEERKKKVARLKAWALMYKEWDSRNYEQAIISRSRKAD